MEKHRWTPFLGAAVTLLTFMYSYAAAENTFDMVGTVKNEQGAPVTDAWVRAKDVNKGIAKVVLTNRGKYTIPGLSPGNYEVEAWKWGFELVERKMGNLDSDRSVDFALKPWSRPDGLPGSSRFQSSIQYLLP